MSKFIALLMAVSLILHVKETYRGHNGKTQVAWGKCSAVWINQRHILTCAHCVGDETKDLWLKTDNNKTFRAKLVKEDKQLDLALLEASIPTERAAVFGELPAVGEKVESVSNPGDLGLLYSEGVVEGYITSEFWGHRLLLESAMMSRGSSGAPVFDRKGRLVGIVELIYESSGGLAGAIPVDVIKKFLGKD